VVSDGKEELVNAQASYHAKVAKLEAGLAAETRSGMRQGIQEELDTAHYKHRLVVGYEKALQEAEAGAGGDVDALLGKVGDLIAARLDDAKGAEVRDQGIFRAHAAHYEKEYLEDMKLLGVRVPDVLTRVTEFMPQIVKYIEKIIENGFAYEAQGSVYFDIREFSKTHGYRKLSWNAASVLAAMAEGEGALASNEGKKSEMDFALWKKSKGGEPSWESPWGGGRPGWHIECSVMASELLGDVLDVHGGGIDLCFPHHDNELAQAEAYYGHQQWVNYFLHSGHLYIGYQKMSKSLKNFFTIREVATTPYIEP
ncbi:tRNA synthetases class I (C) catalytic domain-containing protein, partial [Baffinella frigidus]